MGHEGGAEATVSEKLRLLKSPLISETRSDSIPLHESSNPDLHMFGDRYEPDHACPQFQKHEDASLLELFFDLFFAANYSVFSQTQGVNTHARFKSYLGYFSILWGTWLLTSLYDVRFVTDSIFERAARGISLGVLVGFAVVAPNFDPENQDIQTMRTMSIILCISRLCLAIEYGSILWHIRSFKKHRTPLIIQIAISLAASAIYLGITFRFRHGNSKVFITWYILTAAEVILTLGLGKFWEVLSYTETHLMRRMSLLTIMILGDGIVTVAQNVVVIVKNPDAWDARTVGVITAASVTIYFIFLVYFDWMQNPYLPTIRQQIWTLLHYPFHLALVLFMQGFTQFIIWSKILDTLDHLTFNSIFNDVNAIAAANTTEVGQNLTTLVYDFFKLYPPEYSLTWTAVDNSLRNISTLPNRFWPELAQYVVTEDKNDMPPYNQLTKFFYSFNSISTSMENALLETFNIDLMQEVETIEGNQTWTNVQVESSINIHSWERFRLVFGYTFIAAGATLILMTLLTIVARTRPWKKWSIARTIIFILMGLGMSLIAVMLFHPTTAAKFQESPWLLPTICLVWVAVLALTHVRNPPPLLFSRRQGIDKSKQTYDPVSIPMAKHESTEYVGVGSPLTESNRQQSYYGHPQNEQLTYDS